MLTIRRPPTVATCCARAFRCNVPRLMRRSSTTAVAIGLIAVFAGVTASADERPPLPPPAELSMPPPPGPPPPAKDARRAVELSPSLGVVGAVCHSGSQSDSACRGVGGGAGLSLLALWRVTPNFAWGGSLGVAAMRYEPPPELELESPGAGAAWLLFHGRYYFKDEGHFDPYVELGLGGAALGTVGTNPAGQRLERTGAGPAIAFGGGFDFVLSRYLKLGPTALLTRVFVDKIRECESGSREACADLPRGEQGYLGTLVYLGVRLTILVGQEL